MAYDFDKSLETGNLLIDSQHKELIAAINNLLEACSQGKGREDVKKIGEGFDQSGTSIALIAKVNNIAAWFINHIKVQDKKVVAHLKDAQK